MNVETGEIIETDAAPGKPLATPRQNSSRSRYVPVTHTESRFLNANHAGERRRRLLQITKKKIKDLKKTGGWQPGGKHESEFDELVQRLTTLQEPNRKPVAALAAE